MEDFTVKARKPYTITKQREKWTEEEHNKFLEALKQYGRAWQRIEEHIGTKTAVQIRSHAQKFFSKLEKEAVLKGIALKKALEIEIPPPRPKRKPNTPYPRKANNGDSTCSPVGDKDDKSATASLYHHGKQAPHNDNYPLSQTAQIEKSAKERDDLDQYNSSEVLSVFQETASNSLSSESKSSAAPSVLPASSSNNMELVSLTNQIDSWGAMDESCINVETQEKLTDKDYVDLENGTNKNSNGKSQPTKRKNELKEVVKCGMSSTDEGDTNQAYPCDAPMNTSNLFSETCISNPPLSENCPVGVHEKPNSYTNSTSSIAIEQHYNILRSFHQSLPNFAPPSNPFFHNQDNHQSFSNFPSAYPNLIMSTLLQNPAAYMAASLAASSWPSTNVETSVGSHPDIQGGFSFSHPIHPSDVASLAAATVTAACAWWATLGLLPWCPPFNDGFSCPLAMRTANSRGNDNSHPNQQVNPDFFEAAKPQKSPTMSISEYKETVGVMSKSTEQNHAINEQMHVPNVPMSGLDESSKAKTRKKVNRSSCGSNTPSSSDVEVGGMENHEKVNAASEEPDTSEPSNCRNRNTSNNTNDSWKEVSQEGRLAFQALFSREILPQSFSPPRKPRNKKNNTEDGEQKLDETDVGDTLQLDLNCYTCKTCDNKPGLEKSELLNGNSPEKGFISIGKLKVRRTGFTPYKRCSLEAKESLVGGGSSQGEENGSSKRIRLEKEAST